MEHAPTHTDTTHQDEADDRTMFGFWVYLMTDLLMFAVLFAVFAVLRDSTNGGNTKCRIDVGIGPHGKEVM